MQYVDLDFCKTTVFPYIYAKLSAAEPSAQYEYEQTGLGELDKVLHLVQSDTFYPTLQDKAAYLICSIAGSQYFSNGNKRLGVMVLVSFLILNHAEMRVITARQYQTLMKGFFPNHTWESNPNIRESEPLFLYNLAIAIGDRTRWNANENFETLKKKVSELFSILYRSLQK